MGNTKLILSPQGRMVGKLQPIVNEPERIGKLEIAGRDFKLRRTSFDRYPTS